MFWVTVPFERDPEAVVTVSPFRIIGLLLAMFGDVIAGVSVMIALCCHNMRAFGLDLTIGALMVLLGLVMRWWSSDTDADIAV